MLWSDYTNLGFLISVPTKLMFKYNFIYPIKVTYTLYYQFIKNRPDSIEKEKQWSHLLERFRECVIYSESNLFSFRYISRNRTNKLIEGILTGLLYLNDTKDYEIIIMTETDIR